MTTVSGASALAAAGLWVISAAILVGVAVLLAVRLSRKGDSARKDAIRKRMRTMLRLLGEMEDPVARIREPLSSMDENEDLSDAGQAALESARESLSRIEGLIREMKETGRLGMSAGKPEAETSRLAATREEAPAANDGPKQQTILINGTSGETVSALVDAFRADYEILLTGETENAWETANEKGPDLMMIISSDLDSEATDLCRKVKSTVTTSHIPVILFSSWEDREHIVSGLEAGVDAYMVRPFDVSILKTRVKNILEERERLRNSFLRQDRKTEKVNLANRLDQQFMDSLEEIMEKELDNSEFSVNDLCRSMGMSRTALFNKLKSLTGQGPNDYIRNFRLNKARELLDGGLYSISEVSDMVGFSGPKYFSTSFKKAFGVSPSKI